MKKPSKAVVGYVVLALGVGISLYGVEKNQSDIRDRGEVVRGIICRNITAQDEATLRSLNTKVDRELIKNLHLSPNELQESIHLQLALSASERKALQPSNPATSCSAKLTSIVPPIPPKNLMRGVHGETNASGG